MAAVLCLSCADGAQATREGDELVAVVTPRLDEVLRNGALLHERVAALPSDVAGVPDLQGKVTAELALVDAAQRDLAAFPAKLKDAVRAGRADEARKLVTEQRRTSTARLDAAYQRLDALAAQAAQLEAR